MSFTAGAGPQYTVMEQGGYAQSLVAERARPAELQVRSFVDECDLRKIHFDRIGLLRWRQHPGCAALVSHPLGRTWTFYGDLSYSHSRNSRMCRMGASVPPPATTEALLVPFFANTWDVPTSSLPLIAFSEVAFDVPVTFSGFTGRISHRNVGTIG